MEEMPTYSFPQLVLPWKSDDNPEDLVSREWLVTNGLGGYASGTVRGVATRRHHGLFVPDLPAPRGRTMMVPRVDDEVKVGGRWIAVTARVDVELDIVETVWHQAAGVREQSGLEVELLIGGGSCRRWIEPDGHK